MEKSQISVHKFGAKKSASPEERRGAQVDNRDAPVNGAGQGSYKIMTDLMKQANLAHVELDSNLKISSWNPASEKLFCYSAAEAAGSYLEELVAPTDKISDFNRILCNMLATPHADGAIVSSNVARIGKEMICTWYYSHILSEDGHITGLSVMAQDITEQVKAQNVNLELNRKIDDFLGFAPIGIYQASNDGRLIMANPEMAWMLGYESQSALLQQMTDIATQMFASSESAEQFFFHLFEAEQVSGFRCKLRKNNGTTFWSSSYAKRAFNREGRPDGFYGFALDISRNIRMEEELQEANAALVRIATLDGLTKIANRRKFDDYLSSEWKRASRDGRPISLILSDIDFFKLYNDNYGHQGGDDTLRKVAQCIEANCRRPADLTARYGGEEFVVVLPDTDSQGAIQVAGNLRSAVRNLEIPHEYSKVHSSITISIGVSTIVPTPSTSPEILIEQADAALYQAKKSGRDRFVEYSCTLSRSDP